MEYEKIEVYDPLTEKGDTGESSAGKLNRNFERAASLDDLNNIPAVLYNRDQDLTDTQQEQARKNIGAGVTQRRNGYLAMGDINNAPDQTIGPYGVWIESEEYGIIFQYQAPVGAGNPSITYQMAINPGYGWMMRQYSSVNNIWTDWVNIGVGSGSVRYDTLQDLDSVEMEQAMYNLGLRNFKGKLSVSDLSDMSKIDPEWWCWGETDYFLNSSDDDAKDSNYFWWQSSRTISGELETCQTRINGRRLQRRTKLGRNTSWEGIVWEDIDSSPEDKPYYVELNEIETLSSPEIEDRIGGWDNLRRAIIRGRNINATIDVSGQWVELTGKNQGNYTIVLTDVNSTDDIKTVWKINKSQSDATLTAEKISVNSSVQTANTERYGTVILGYGAGDYRDAGRVATMDEDGKIPNKNLRDAYSNPTEGGIVKVTYNGGTMDKYKVPFVGDNGVLSPYVLPKATNEEKGAVTLASNTGNSTDSGKVPVLGTDGKLSVNTLPAGLSPAPVNGRLYVNKDGSWVQDSNYVTAYNNTAGYLVNTDIIAGSSDVLGVTFQIIGNQYSASTGFSGIPYFCVIQAYWHGINNTFYDPACIAFGNRTNFNNVTVFRRLVDGSYRICIRFESKQYNNFSVAAYTNNDVSGRNRVTNISSSTVPGDAISTTNVTVKVGYNDTNANLSTVDWNANHLITAGWVRFGGEINMRPPKTGSWGSGLYFRKQSDNSNLAAIVAIFQDEVFDRYYIGWGTNPLDPAKGLALGDNTFTYKSNNVYHAGNSNMIPCSPKMLYEYNENGTTGIIIQTDINLDGVSSSIGISGTITGDNFTANTSNMYSVNCQFSLEFNSTANVLSYVHGVNFGTKDIENMVAFKDVSGNLWIWIPPTEMVRTLLSIEIRATNNMFISTNFCQNRVTYITNGNAIPSDATLNRAFTLTKSAFTTKLDITGTAANSLRLEGHSYQEILNLITGESGLYVINASPLISGSPTSEQIELAIGGWDNLVQAINNKTRSFVVTLGNTSVISANVNLPSDTQVQIDFSYLGVVIYGIIIENTSGTLSLTNQQVMSLTSDNLVQTTGDSETSLMSQKATTDALNLKMDKTQVVHTSGNSTTDVISQDGVTKLLAEKAYIGSLNDLASVVNGNIPTATPTKTNNRWVLESDKLNIITLSSEDFNVQLGIPADDTALLYKCFVTGAATGINVWNTNGTNYQIYRPENINMKTSSAKYIEILVTGEISAIMSNFALCDSIISL